MDCIEVIVVDDGSIDQGAEIAGRYQEKYPSTFILIQQPNGGHGCAVDAGIARCTGKYFKVLDADDWLRTKALARVVRRMRQIDVQVIACGYDICKILSKTVVHRKMEVGNKEDGQGIRFLSMHQLIQEWDRYSQLFCLHGLIYRTDFYKSLLTACRRGFLMMMLIFSRCHAVMQINCVSWMSSYTFIVSGT